MTKKEIDKAFLEMTGIIKTLVWSFHRKTGLPVPEIERVANLAFVDAANHYQPDRGKKFSSWCYTKVYFYLVSFGRKHLQLSQTYLPIENFREDVAVVHPAPYRDSILDRSRDLSPGAQAMIRAIVDSPRTDDEVREIRNDARDHMRFGQGLTRKEIAELETEIKAMLKG